MSTEKAELPGEEDERGWRDRFGEVTAAGQTLLATRLAILREELSVKAAVAAVLGWRALTRVRPLEFPAVGEELARDWQAIAATLSPDSGPDAGSERADDDLREPIDDIEERFRAGAE